MLEAWKVLSFPPCRSSDLWAGVVTVMVPVVTPQLGCVTLNTGVGGGVAAVMVVLAVAVQVLSAVLLIVMVLAIGRTPRRMMEAWKGGPSMLYSEPLPWAGVG